MAWVVVPCLDALCDQLNAIAPNRDKSSDGSIGDTSHAADRSSHNQDRTGNPEHRDGDAADEVRARDFDKDLREPGLTMAMIVKHLVLGARSGRFWWIRYIIFDGIIYHKSTGYQARTYTGQNKHTEHAHVNSDFTQKADTVRGVDYGLDELVAMSDGDFKKISDMLAASEKRTADRIGQLWATEWDIDFHPDKVYRARADSIIAHIPGEHTHLSMSVDEAKAKLATLITLCGQIKDKIEGLESGPIGTDELIAGLKTVLREGVSE